MCSVPFTNACKALALTSLLLVLAPECISMTYSSDLLTLSALQEYRGTEVVTFYRSG